MTKKQIKERLEYLRGELRKGDMSYGELYELQSLSKHIDSGDVELLEAAGVPEFEEIEERGDDSSKDEEILDDEMADYKLGSGADKEVPL